MIVVDSAIRVHRELGPGLLESASRACHMNSERSGWKSYVEKKLPVAVLGEILIDLGYRMDMGCGKYGGDRKQDLLRRFSPFMRPEITGPI